MPYSAEPNFWADVAKSFAGAFFGAGLAFASTLFVQSRQQREERVRAGNLAVAVLQEMQNAFLSIRRNMLGTKNIVLSVSPNAPPWLYFKPTSHPYNKELRFDLIALSFLFDRHGAAAAQTLTHLQGVYRSLMLLLDEHRDTKELIQTRLAELGVGGGTFVPPNIEGQIGLHLIQKANDLASVLLDHFGKDEAVYKDAIQVLRRELIRRYGDRFLSIAPVSGVNMNEEERKERQRLYEKTRDEVNAATRSMAESLDRSLLTLSSGFLGGSLAFINQVVNLGTAKFMLVLYGSWTLFAMSVIGTIASLVLGILHQRPLHEAAEKFYLRGDESAWAVSESKQTVVFRWIIACGVSFIIGVVLLGAFVILNLSRGS